MHTTVTQMIKAAPAMTTMTPSAATMQMQHNFRNAYDVQSVFRNIISLHEFATTSRYKLLRLSRAWQQRAVAEGPRDTPRRTIIFTFKLVLGTCTVITLVGEIVFFLLFCKYRLQILRRPSKSTNKF